ncbi:hypothetical protein BVX93_02225, partial [bacterium B13(2017)]
IDDYAILVSTPERIGSDEMETRYYHLSAGIGEFMEFKHNEEATNTGGITKGSSSSSFGVDSEIEDKVTIKDVLMNSGVPFPPGSNVFMDKRTGTLIVHNTPENLAMVEKILEIIDKPPFQINIQAKFVRISQSDLEELGFEWLLKSPIRVGHPENGANKWQVDADSQVENIFLNNGLGNTQIGGGVNGTGAINGIDTSMPNFAVNGSLMSFSGMGTPNSFCDFITAIQNSRSNKILPSSFQISFIALEA